MPQLKGPARAWGPGERAEAVEGAGAGELEGAGASVPGRQQQER